ncbi:MAG: SUMF1/EgtB/PvdO family nonheme iron enzyme [Gammaproteobacteria bacterium]|nr:SUMF1/EgtB/PvdO family nonheme iron enzyme [Gammaproteobacteria bacterium]
MSTTAAVSAPDVQWKIKFFNPKPMEGDVILPLPCGGAMTFRRINVESTGPLSDVRIDLGSSDDLWGYSENTLAHYIAGSFAADKAPTRYFLIGKYEVSQLQYKAVVENDCPKPSMKLRLPQNRVGWFDAVSFADKLSQWLLKNAPDKLPREQDELGFVRLPTETEWEYVARGGDAVSIADFRETTFPMPDGMERYVWFAGTRSANGKMQLTGLLMPNPLGVHDILGNVDEIVWDAFRLNRLDRLHGQIGGFTVRGGNYFTSEQDIRTSQREEVPYFDSAGPRRSKTTGFRVAVSAPVVVSKERLTEIKDGWVALGNEQAPSNGASLTAKLSESVNDDPVAELATLSEFATDENMRARLQRLGSIMRATLDARNRQRDAAARSGLRMGGVICQQVGQDGKVVTVMSRLYKQLCSIGSEADRLYSKEQCEKRKQRLDEEEGRYLRNVGVYADSIIEVARNYDGEVLAEQKKLLLAKLENSEGGRRLGEFVKVYSLHAEKYAENWLVKRDAWSEGCREAFPQR